MAALIGHLGGRIVFVDFSSRKVALDRHACFTPSPSSYPTSSTSLFPPLSTCSSATSAATRFTDSHGAYTLPPARAAPRIRSSRRPAPPEHLPGTVGLPSAAGEEGSQYRVPQGRNVGPESVVMHGGPFSGTYRGVTWNAQGLFMAKAAAQR